MTSTRDRIPLAIIGIGCRLPAGIGDPREYWRALCEGRDGIRPVPSDRWSNDYYYDPDRDKAGKTRNDRAGFLEQIDRFDADFFGFFPAEAARIDPQQRLLLEITHEAFEDAGLRVESLARSRTSVFIGSFMYDYLCQQTSAEARTSINPYVAMGTGLTSLANRISYVYDLVGPSVSLDTACSSSLVALHLAARSVWSGDAELAIAGGVNLLLRPESTVMLSKAGFLNCDGKCKAFDARASGYVRAEGAGVVLLKPLDRAEADGDRIYAVLRGTAVNQDGHVSEGFTVPSATAQIAVLRAAYADAGVDPGTVDYIEAHGTGTAVGDPIECRALGTVVGQARPSGAPLVIGSVKTNLGHLEGAAGITGFIKGVLVAANRRVPKNLHFETPNPAIDFAGLGLRVADRPLELRGDEPIRVGVNSFGAGGTNAHAVIESYVPASSPAARAGGARVSDRERPFVLSARSEAALRELASRHATRLATCAEPDELDALGRALLERRSRYRESLTVSAGSLAQLRERLQGFARGEPTAGVSTTTVTGTGRPRIAFMFSGQGGQWARMGMALYREDPGFRSTIDAIDRRFAALGGRSLLAELEAPEQRSRINDTVIVQPAIMAIQIALATVLIEAGVEPEGVVGHSIGEVAAAFVAGAIDLDEAVFVIYHRSRLQDRASGKGRMLAVGLDADEARKLLRGHEDRVQIAAYNGPRMLALAGDRDVIERLAEQVEAAGGFQRFVRVDVPYHSHHMEPIRDAMLETMADVRGRSARRALYSTVTTAREDGTHLDARYWYDNVREPVRFTATIERMLDDGYDAFIEIGPHPVLVGGATELFASRGRRASAWPSMHRRQPEAATLNAAIGHAFAHGAPISGAHLFPGGGRPVALPPHPWIRERFWFEPPAAERRRLAPRRHPFLAGETRLVTEDSARIWDAELEPGSVPFLSDHQVDGESVLPATGHLELARAVAAEGGASVVALRDLHFDAALVYGDGRFPHQVRLEIHSGEGDYHVCSRPGDSEPDAPWTRHCGGRICKLPEPEPPPAPAIASVLGRFAGRPSEDVAAFYARIEAAGLRYGPAFQCARALWHEDGEVLAELSLPEALRREGQQLGAHPALLDACLHAVFIDVHRRGDPARVYLPHTIARVRFHAPLGAEVRCYLRISRHDDLFLQYDAWVFDRDGALLVEMLGLSCKRIAGARGSGQDVELGGHAFTWVEEPTPSERNHDLRTAIVLGPDAAHAEAIAAALRTRGVGARVLGPEHCATAAGRVSLRAELGEQDLDRRCEMIFAAAPDCDGDRDGDLGAWSASDLLPPSLQGLLNLGQALADLDVHLRLSLVTCAAMLSPVDDDVRLGHAALVGVLRVLRNEHPSIPARVIDLPARPDAEALTTLADELLHTRRDVDEVELALRGGRRFVRELRPVDVAAADTAATVQQPGVGGAYRAGLAQIGLLDTVELRAISTPAPGPGEVELDVEAAALNFKDIVNGMGVLPERAVAGGLSGAELGLEVSGVVRRVGEGASLRVGQRVAARVSHGFAGRVLARTDCVTEIGDELDATQAAAIPVVYLTAYYGLCYLARMSADDTVLVHSAAGGVGHAAIQLARAVGAKVIATAGTRDKRAALRAAGIEHVFDSRSLDFHPRVMEVTGGRGVDIVLNSLTGSFITQGLESLAPFGRFVEIGKADIYKNGKLSLERLGQNISLFVVDVDRMATQRPQLHRRLLGEVMAMVRRGEVAPPPVTTFPITRLDDAMKHMSRANYVGKVVVDMRGAIVPVLPARTLAAVGDGSYLITGGCGGLGLELARWLVTRGAAHLVLLSRGGLKRDADRAVVEGLRARGTTVEVVQADVGDAAAIDAVVGRFGRDWPRLAGIVHAAGLLDDAQATNLTPERFRRVFVPKAVGAWHLQQAVARHGHAPELRLHISSISGVLGLLGQANYAAANHVLDTLAELGRRRGEAVTSVGLGVLGSYAGMSRPDEDTEVVLEQLASHGMTAMPLDEVLARVERAIVQGAGHRMLARLDWRRFVTAYPHLRRDRRLLASIDAQQRAGGGASKGGLVARLAAVEGEARTTMLAEELASTLAGILDLDASKLDPSHSIDVLGLDSLVLNQLRNFILRNLGVSYPLIKLFKGPSLVELAAELAGSVGASSAEVEAKGDGRRGDLLDDERLSPLGPWLIRGAGSASAPVRLVCLHSMGVGASLFSRFLLEPPAGVDVLAVQTPGRENRRHEPAIDRVDGLVDEIAAALRPRLDRPFVLWGHSFGGIVAHELARRLRDDGFHLGGLLVTGTIAPQHVVTWQRREVMLRTTVADNDAEYLISLSRYVEDTELIRSILPLMRKDTPLMMSYAFRDAEPLTCPITAFSARQDDMVYADEIDPWRQRTVGEFRHLRVDGDHWFLDRNRAAIVAALDELVAGALREDPSAAAFRVSAE